jgi:hypothetical protein
VNEIFDEILRHRQNLEECGTSGKEPGSKLQRKRKAQEMINTEEEDEKENTKGNKKQTNPPAIPEWLSVRIDEACLKWQQRQKRPATGQRIGGPLTTSEQNNQDRGIQPETEKQKREREQKAWRKRAKEAHLTEPVMDELLAAAVRAATRKTTDIYNKMVGHAEEEEEATYQIYTNGKWEGSKYTITKSDV